MRIYFRMRIFYSCSICFHGIEDFLGDKVYFLVHKFSWQESGLFKFCTTLEPSFQWKLLFEFKVVKSPPFNQEKHFDNFTYLFFCGWLFDVLKFSGNWSELSVTLFFWLILSWNFPKIIRGIIEFSFMIFFAPIFQCFWFSKTNLEYTSWLRIEIPIFTFITFEHNSPAGRRPAL